ncbi:hypothetical protein AB3X91_16050 [Paraburkholderia sp. BR14263]
MAARMILDPLRGLVQWYDGIVTSGFGAGVARIGVPALRHKGFIISKRIV